MYSLGLGRVWGGPPLYRRNGIEVRERAGVRTLHLASDTVQSAMRIDRPDALELSYTRAMMAFLLFVPPPARLALIGLGGGSLVKFVYRTMPETRLVAVEVDAEIVDVARVYFGLPEEGGRLRFVIGDGARVVESVQGDFGVLLVDAYDGQSLAASLGTDAFFRHARRALGESGVFAMNLWSNDRGFDGHVRAIERAFEGYCLCLPAERPGNVIVLAFAECPLPDSLHWATLYERAKVLEQRFGLEFCAFVSNLRRMNRHDDAGLVMSEDR